MENKKNIKLSSAGFAFRAAKLKQKKLVTVVVVVVIIIAVVVIAGAVDKAA